MTSTIRPAATTQVYRVYIKATPQAIWDAITRPEWTVRYGYRGASGGELRPGGAFKTFPTATSHSRQHAPDMKPTDPVAEGEVLEVDPPRRLVMTLRLLLPAEAAAEPASRLTYEIVPGANGVTALTLVHELDGAPITAAIVGGALEERGAGGGHAWILSDLKTLLETGAGFAG